MQLKALIGSIDGLLEPWRYKDYAPNGLQVEGRAEVRKLLTGVTASQALIDKAVQLGVDAILVHHGYFWKGEEAVLRGIKRQRIKTLLVHDISLLAYHLPLDGHPEFGNNALLGERLGLIAEGHAGDQGLLWYGKTQQDTTGKSLTEEVSRSLNRQAQLLGRAEKVVRRIAWCTGGAQGFFPEAIDLGVDAFITGEVSEQNYHMALENDVVFISAGHHATERYGIQALGEKLAEMHGMNVQFFDVENPV